MNDAIHGFIRQGNCELLASNIVQGNIYEISRFFTSYSQPSYKIVPHPAQIHFTGKTIIKHIPELPASIPLHCFYLIDYSLLASRSKNEILSEKKMYKSLCGETLHAQLMLMLLGQHLHLHLRFLQALRLPSIQTKLHIKHREHLLFPESRYQRG
ncbi:putative nucleic acid-binding protein [Rosa chinensis]|uniref:Putative nucleic acid-binding protein n=1 Tax=Rosa chinensis TaxID=74649 RepID=A0A2P6RZK5_ROSCH|nr:putative nucleic acid-binding protein [Rosa chinensis]